MNASLATKRAGLGCGLVRRTAGARASTGARAQGSARRSVHRQIRRNLRHEVDVTRGQSPSKVVARATADECPCCFERCRDSALVPCGHVLCAVCVSTYASAGTCPVCRQDIANVVRIFL